ncbi:coiled-coil domain-containing protein 97 [Athene noctua]|uniref:coiled-coil domain-containing protein 97 n=1 Tax=Athene noctua TaxID=126797 RepID=UPI003EBAB26E
MAAVRDPKTEGDPEITEHEPEPSEGGPPKTPPPPQNPSKRDPPSPKNDSTSTLNPKISNRNPPVSPPRDPKMEEGGGHPLLLEGGGERWPPQSGFWGRPRRPPARTRLRNRRFAALRQLIQAGEYFSEEEMRAREPLLYQHYIGQYHSGGGGSRDEPLRGGAPSTPQFLGTPPTPPSLSELLLRSVEEAAVQQRLLRHRQRDGDSGDEADSWVPDAGERAMLREEFTSRMYQRFLDGEDGDFDYSQVDENPDLDNLDIVSRDAEERYFDEEEPSVAPQLE